MTTVLPPCPVEVATDVGSTLLGEDVALRMALTARGGLRAAAATPARSGARSVLTAAAVTATALFDLSIWLPVAVFVVSATLGVLSAEAEYAHLRPRAHRRPPACRLGAWTRLRTALERDGVIGWVVQQNLFQRRAGVASLVATTAAGAEKVLIRDVPLGRAVALADAATPGLLTPFLVAEQHDGPAAPRCQQGVRGRRRGQQDQRTVERRDTLPVGVGHAEVAGGSVALRVVHDQCRVVRRQRRHCRPRAGAGPGPRASVPEAQAWPSS